MEIVVGNCGIVRDVIKNKWKSKVATGKENSE